MKQAKNINRLTDFALNSFGIKNPLKKKAPRIDLDNIGEISQKDKETKFENFFQIVYLKRIYF